MKWKICTKLIKIIEIQRKNRLERKTFTKKKRLLKTKNGKSQSNKHKERCRGFTLALIELTFSIEKKQPLNYHRKINKKNCDEKHKLCIAYGWKRLVEKDEQHKTELHVKKKSRLDLPSKADLDLICSFPFVRVYVLFLFHLLLLLLLLVSSKLHIDYIRTALFVWASFYCSSMYIYSRHSLLLL